MPRKPKPDTAEPEVADAARTLGKRSGSKGGKARAAALTPEQRSEIARHAVNARWTKQRVARMIKSKVRREVVLGYVNVQIGHLGVYIDRLRDGENENVLYGLQRLLESMNRLRTGLETDEWSHLII
jgi:hypothetical protein